MRSVTFWGCSATASGRSLLAHAPEWPGNPVPGLRAHTVVSLRSVSSALAGRRARSTNVEA